MYLDPGDVVVPTAVESHIANAHYHCVWSRYARPTYVISLDVSINCGMSLGYLLNPRQQKTRYIAVTGFSYLKPGNVVVPTAVESHIANGTLSLAGARLRAVLLL